MESEYSSRFQKYFRDRIQDLIRLDHKGNNILFEAIIGDKRYLIKLYSAIHRDNWNRGLSEFRAMSHLWNNGLREIPEPFLFHQQENTAIYSYEEGRILKSAEVEKEDIINAADFLARMHNLGDKNMFGPASSACFSLSDYAKVLDRRLGSMIDYQPTGINGKKAKKFLDTKVIPKISEIKKEFFKNSQGLDIEKEIPLEEQVLASGDFGFHNILKSDRYTFLDFEYFGRDDPIREILYFLHHESSDGIKEELKQLFIEEYMKRRFISDSFKERLHRLDPLIGMTLVLIYLNILSDKQQEHLRFSRGDIDGLLEERLEKAEKKLKKFRHFN